MIAVAVAVTACKQTSDTAPARAPVTVTSMHFDFLGKQYRSIEELSVAVDANKHIQIGLNIAEEQGCVSEARVAAVVAMLEQRDHVDLSFIGHSEVADEYGRQLCTG